MAAHTLLAAVLCSLPHWVALWRNGGDYTPFSVSPAVSAIVYDETHAYAPPARRFCREGRVPAEVDNFENRERRAAVPLIPPVILGSMARALGGVERAFIAADCVFPALLFVLLFALARGLSLNWRLLVAWSTLLVSFGILNGFWIGEDALIAPLEITRTPQPEISFLILLATAGLFACALEKNASWRWIIAAGILSGDIVYCYYFYTIAWGSALVSAFVLGLVWRRRILWTRALVALLIMIVLAVPYLLAALHSAGQTDLLGRVGVFTREVRIFPLLLALLLAGGIWHFGRKLADPISLVVLFLIFGAVAGLNAHVVTGYETQPWHFWKRLAVPLAFFLLAGVVARALEQMRYSRALALTLLSALLVDNGARLCVAGLRTAPDQRVSNPENSLLRWADQNLPEHRVLGTVDPELILLIPALTDDYTYVPSGIRSLTSTSEIVARYYQLACLLGLTPPDVENAAAVPSHLGHSTELLHALGLSSTGSPAMFHEFVGDYRASFQRCPGVPYRLDYVIVSSDAEQQAVGRKLPTTRELYRNVRYRLLEVRR